MFVFNNDKVTLEKIFDQQFTLLHINILHTDIDVIRRFITTFFQVFIRMYIKKYLMLPGNIAHSFLRFHKFFIVPFYGSIKLSDKNFLVRIRDSPPYYAPRSQHLIYRGNVAPLQLYLNVCTSFVNQEKGYPFHKAEFTSQFLYRKFISIPRAGPAPLGSTLTFDSLLSSSKVSKRS